MGESHNNRTEEVHECCNKRTKQVREISHQRRRPPTSRQLHGWRVEGFSLGEDWAMGGATGSLMQTTSLRGAGASVDLCMSLRERLCFPLRRSHV